MFWRCFWKNIDVDVFDDVLQNAKHRAYDASNDVNRPPLGDTPEHAFLLSGSSLMGEGLCGAPVTLLCISGHLRYDLWSTPRHGCCAGTRWMCEARPHGKVWLGQQRWCAVWIYKLVPRDAFPTPIKAALVSPHHCCCPHPSCII